MPMSSYLREKLAQHTFAQTAYTMPTNVYLAAFTQPLNTTSGITDEVSGGGYSRVDITGLLDESDGVITNNDLIKFNVATADWGDIYALAVMDSISGSNILIYSNLDTPVTINTSSVLGFFAGDFVTTFR